MSDRDFEDRSGVSEEELDSMSVECETAETFISKLKDLLSNPDQIPLAPVAFGGMTVEEILSLMDGMLKDQWLVENCVVICFDNSSDNSTRHVAVTRKEYESFWCNDVRAKNHLRTSNITSYPFADYWKQMVAQFSDVLSKLN